MTSAILHRQPQHPPALAFEGFGPYVAQSRSEGRATFLDLSSGAGCLCLGYGNSDVTKAMKDQIDRLPYVHSGAWTTNVAEILAQRLVGFARQAHPRFDGGSVFFLNSGAEANEAAVKVAVQACTARQTRPVLFGRRHSYHGATMFTLALGDHPRKHMFRGAGMTASHIFRLPAYMPSWFGSEEARDMHLANVVRDTAAMFKINCATTRPPIVIMEPIGGTTIGIEPPSTPYLGAMRELVTAAQGVLIYDEVLSGNFRTGDLFSFAHYQKQTALDVSPDIITIGKGLTAGYFPLSAVILSKELTDILRGCQKLGHTSTNMNHPLGCAAALAALDVYESRISTLAAQHNYIASEIVPRLRDAPPIYGVHGVGGLWGVRYNPRQDAGALAGIVQQAANLGASCYAEGGTVNGHGNWILFAPPLTMQPGELNEAASIMSQINNQHGLRRGDKA